MRITLISPWGSPCGISVYAGDVYSELVRRGHEVQVLAYEETQPSEMKVDLPVHRIWSICQPPTWRVLEQIREFQPDVIHVQHEIGFFCPGSCWQDWLACLKSTGARVVVTYHSLPDVPTVLTDTPVSLGIVCSPLGGEIFRARADFPVVTIEHGVDGAIPTDRQPEPYSLVSFGFLAECKGYERIMHAMRLLRSDLPELNLTILGSVTPRAFGEQLYYFQHLQRLTHELGLSGQVDVSLGFRTQREVQAVLSRKALAVLHYDRTDRLPVSASFIDSTSSSAALRVAGSDAEAAIPDELLSTSFSAMLQTANRWNSSLSDPRRTTVAEATVPWAHAAAMGWTADDAYLGTSGVGGFASRSPLLANATAAARPYAGPPYLPRFGAASVRCQSAAVYRVWSSGVPCIVSQAQHFELGQPAANALIQARDVPQLVTQIRRLFTDQQEYQNAVSRLGTCLTRTWKDVADDYERAFVQVLQTT